jgi:hypothetical protein
MKKLLGVAVPAVLAVLALSVLLSSARTREQADGAARERARVKREFVERSALARTLDPADPAAWQGEVKALSRLYLGQLAEVRTRFPDAPPAPSALEAARAERGDKLSPKDKDAIGDFEKYAQGRFALLRDGTYAPAASAVDQGLRLDLVAIETGASPAGGPGLRIDFALWGAPRLLERETAGKGEIVTRTVLPVTLRGMTFKFLDATGAHQGGMEGPGEPYQKLVDPERFVDDFPPGVLFGTWWIELLPREAVTLEATVDADVRGAAGSRPARFAFKLPVPEGWKIPPGTTYQATVREVAAEPRAGAKR